MKHSTVVATTATRCSVKGLASNFLAALFTFALVAFAFTMANAQGAFVRSTASLWGDDHSGHIVAMDANFGAGNWTDERFETVNVADLLANHSFIYLEGGDNGTNEMAAFIAANQADIEAWVSNGGHIFINAAPNEGGNQDLGFGVTLLYSNLHDNGQATDPAHPVVDGIATFYEGNYFGHALICPAGMVSIMHEENVPANVNLAGMNYGDGYALFGGITLPWFDYEDWNPQPDFTQLAINIVGFAAEGAEVVCTPELTIDCPADVTLACGDDYSPEMGGGLPVITANDCVGDLDISFMDDQISNNNCPLIIARTWVATDGENTEMCTQTITIVDDEAPVITNYPEDMTIECSEGQTIDEVLAYLDNNVPFPTIEDCNSFEVFVEPALATEGLECPVVAVCSKTITAIDECGNESSITFSVTIEDHTAPEFSDFEEEILVDCLEEVPAPEDLTAYDSCSDEDVDVEVFESNTGELIESCDLATAFGPGDDWAIWLPSLANEGLLSSANFHFDDNGGTFDRFADGTGHIYGVVVNDVNPGEQFMVDFWFENESDWNAWSALGRSYKDDLGCAEDGNLYEGWTYFEMVNGFSTMTGLADNAGDVLYFYHMPDSYYFGFQIGEGANNKNCDYGISGWFTYDGFIGGEAVEGHGDLNADASCEPNNEQDCVHNTEFTYFYRAEDECGNVNIDSQLIIVDDQVAPEFTNLPEDLTLPCDDVNYELPMVEAVDNCVGEVVVEYLGEEIIDGDCPHNYQIVHAWAAFDVCGNRADGEWTITVVDEEAPELIGLPEAEITVECDMVEAAADVTVMDNCSEEANIEFSFNEEIIDGDCPGNYTIIRNWYAMDECGNESSFEQIVNVQDTTAPEFNDYEFYTAVPCEDIDTYTLTASDNCGEATVEIVEEILQSGGCLGVLYRVYEATDECGNTSTVEQYITITDTTAPELVNIPADETLECSDVALGDDGNYFDAGDVYGVDNCGNEVTIEYSEEIAEDGDDCEQSYLIIRTWVAIDYCENESMAQQTVTIVDTTSPEFVEFPADETVECDEELPAVVFPIAEDNCDDVVSIELTEEIVDGECENEYVLNRIFRAFDDCGNEVMGVQTINVVDTTAPEFTMVPEAINVECDEEVPATEATAIDNCGDVTITYDDQFLAQGDCPQEFSMIRTFTAVDACGNSSTATQQINIVDTTAPVFDEYPAEVEVPCDDINADILTATDNCGDVTVTYEDTMVSGGCAGTIIRDYLAVDECGNETAVQQILSLYDNEAPEFTNGPADVTVECDNIPAVGEVVDGGDDNNGELGAGAFVRSNASLWGGVNAHVVAMDALYGAGNWSDLRFEDVDINDLLNDHGFIYLEGGDAGATAMATFLAANLPALENWVDNGGRLLMNASPNVVGNINLGFGGVELVYPSFTEIAEASDAAHPIFNGIATTYTGNWFGHSLICPAGMSAIMNAQGAPSDVVLAEMAYGNGRVVFGGTTLPFFSEPSWDPQPDFQLLANSIVAYAADGAAAVATDISAEDNCDDDVEIEYVGEEIIPGDCPNNYTIVRTWVATDNCDNEAFYTQNITVEDTTAPEFEFVAEDVTLECDEELPAPEALAFDNCGEVTIEVSPEIIDGECDNEYTMIRTYTATDECGNSTTATQTLTIVDTTAPEFTFVPEDATYECDEEVPAINAEASDNCGDVTVTFEDEIIENDNDEECDNDGFSGPFAGANWTESYDGGDGSITFTSDDLTIVGTNNGIGGNTEATILAPGNGTLSFAWDYSTNDVDGPSYDVAYYINGERFDLSDSFGALEQDGFVLITLNAGDVLGFGIDSSDGELGSATLIVSDFGYNGDCGGCPQAYQIERTFTAVDACGNESSTTQIISVVDTTAPVFDEYPAEVEVPCDDINAELLTASDNCGEVTITYEDTFVSGGCAGTIIRDYLAVDECGNEATAQQILSLYDNTAPEFVEFPSDMDVECDDIPAVAQELAAEDNCDEEVEIEYLGEEIIEGDCPQSYTIVRTWVAIDNCDNETEMSQNINVSDNEAPEFEFVAEDVTLECDEELPAPEALAFDNCGEVTIEVSPEIIDGECDNEYTMIRTYTATDECGNSATATQTLTIVDTTAPEFTFVPADATYECDEEVPAINAEAIDNCGDVEVSYTDDVAEGECANEYSIVRLFTAVDACGNSSTAVQNITVVDTTAPVFDAFEIEVETACDNVDVPFLTATDNCGDVEITFEDTYVSGGCAGTIVRDYVAVDECGNEAYAQQILSLVDEVAPVFTMSPADMDADCDDIPAVSDALAAEDNCDEEVEISYLGEEILPGDCPQSYTIVRTWVAIDNCDNETLVSQNINVSDNEAPEFEFVAEDETLECDEELPAPFAVAFDNCGEVTIDVTAEIIDGECANEYTMIRTYVATDECGNSTSATQTLTVVDTTAPVFTFVPADVTYECDEEIVDMNAEASDNCGDVTVTYTDDVADSDCDSEYSIVRVFTATDACGNTATASQNITVVDTTAPVLDGTPDAELALDCEDEVPAAADVTAFDACEGDVEVSYTEELIGDLPAEGSSADCVAMTPEAYEDGETCAGTELWSVVLFNFDGQSASYYSTLDANWVEYPDGTATLTGTVYNNQNANAGWVIDVEFENGLPWEEWSTQGFPTSFKDDCGISGDNHLDWMYYIMSEGATLTGWGDYDGSSLNLSHAPANYYYGYQVGIAANNVNENYGSGGWFTYSGSFLGADVNGSGDFAFDHDCCPQYSIERTWCAVDCAGNETCFTQVIYFEDQSGSNPVIGVDADEYVPVAFKGGEETRVNVYPNPAIDRATVEFNVENDGMTVVEIISLNGQKVAEVYNANAEAGTNYRIDLDARNLPTGVYLYRLTTENDVITGRLVVNK